MSLLENITYHPVGSDQEKAFFLWHSVFGDPTEHFQLYYSKEAVPSDTLGAWEGDKLVSTVHVCRLNMILKQIQYGESSSTSLSCGGITNVVTDINYRRRGLSHALLSQVFEKMKEEKFDYSLLGTHIPSHYAILGWELVNPPTFRIDLHAETKLDCSSETTKWTSSTDLTHTQIEKLFAIYSKDTRSLSFNRSFEYMKQWVLWHWHCNKALINFAPNDEGYIVLSTNQFSEKREEKKDEQNVAMALEWIASNKYAEQNLLRALITEVKMNHNKKSIEFAAMPQHIENIQQFSEEFGNLSFDTKRFIMIRNICLNDEQYTKIKTLYDTSHAVWWPSDDFWGISSTLRQNS